MGNGEPSNAPMAVSNPSSWICRRGRAQAVNEAWRLGERRTGIGVGVAIGVGVGMCATDGHGARGTLTISMGEYVSPARRAEMLQPKVPMKLVNDTAKVRPTPRDPEKPAPS